MTAIIVIPYGPSPLREQPLKNVLAHLETAPWPVTVAISDIKPFPLAEVVNAEVAQTKTDIVILHAADTITPIAQMEVAVHAATAQPGLVFAYTHYVRLTEDDRRGKVLVEPPAHACVAIRRDCWDQLGGYDEFYRGWGMEDLDFNRRAQALWPNRRIPGELIHFWHGDRRRDDSDLDTPAEVVAANWRHLKATG